MEQWGFYFDQTRCTNCLACVIACKVWNEDKRGDAHLTPELTWLDTNLYDEPSEYENLMGSTGEINFSEYSKFHMKENWRRVYSTEIGDRPPNVDVLNLSVSCNHCSEPGCVDACPMNRIIKENEFGIVMIDETKQCISCERCSDVCEWGSPQFYKKVDKSKLPSKDAPKMTKCNLCIDRIRDGLKPACVAACPMRALDAGPIDELKAMYPDWEEVVDGLPDKVIDGKPTMKPNIIFKRKKARVQR